MQTIACPHCGFGVQDDGSLGGQIVSCPSCVRNFTMPALAVMPQIVPIEPRRSVRLDVRANGPSAAIVIGGLAFVIVAIAIAVLVVGEIRAERDKQRAVEALQELDKAFDKLEKAVNGKPPK